VSFALTDRDNGLKAIVERVGSLSKASVRVGVLEDRAGEAKRARGESEVRGLTILEVATVHEFGAPAAGIPARSFIRGTVDEREGEIRADQHRLAVQYLSGKIAIRKALDVLGARVAAKIQQRIARGITPPLLPRTVARKGSSKPLVDTGQLRSSITWEVES
jgi:hypothetical protein